MSTDPGPGQLTPAQLAATAEEHRKLAGDALMRADDITAGYLPGINILEECNFYLGDGEIVGIIGPNGAGKSTLLKTLFGLIPVRKGSVTLRGDDITSAKATSSSTRVSVTSRRHRMCSPR